MAFPPIYSLLLAVVIKSCHCDFGQNRESAVQIGELLKPPPPPPIKNLLPVPFHSSGKESRQNWDATGYSYQPPPPPPPNLKNIAPSNLKIPSGFHKQQYNLNYNNNFTTTFKFIPPPQPFTTTTSPSIFQKVSGWLFSPHGNYQTTSSGTFPPASYVDVKSIPKECNPCNLVPWMPVIRYNNDLKNMNQNMQPNLVTSPFPVTSLSSSSFASSSLGSSSLSTPSSTYGPPSPTAYAHNGHINQDIVQFYPKPFQSSHQIVHTNPVVHHYTPSISHAVYGHTLSHSFLGAPVHADLGSTYGPPSPTHTVAVPSHSPPTSTIGDHSSTFPIPSSYGVPSQSSWEPSPSYGPPAQSYDRERLNPTYGPPSAQYGLPLPFPKQTITPTPESSSAQFNSFNNPSSSPEPISTHHASSSSNNDFGLGFNFDDITGVSPVASFQLPKVEHPMSFKNSYGEEINASDLEVLFPVSATAAASIKIKTQVLPNATSPKETNQNLALSNPAPFTLNKGRNIHTLQPVALPNLSVSPLPPIFNARPFRPPTPKLEESIIQKLNSMQNPNHVKIQQSLPIAEFTQSIDYPPTVIQSPIIDIDDLQKNNHTKSYRNIFNPNEDHNADIAYQASEDHISATKANQDISFESTGTDFVNDVSNDIPMDFKRIPSVPVNHKPHFSDLRGMDDQDVDKFRSENNLQNIDSPLLYLKPSAPHKKFENFVTPLAPQSNVKDYEIYDDISTTPATQFETTLTSGWDESRSDYSDMLPPIDPNEDKPKIVQIIVPYTTNKQSNNDNDHDINNYDDDYQPRKVPNHAESSFANTVSEIYTTISTTELPTTETTDQYEAILNDLYDVKGPPFDIVKLQHTIDDWTEQEYSKRTKSSSKSRENGKYAKKIPDEFFTTIGPVSNNYGANNFFEWYDHEGESSVINRSIVKMKNDTFVKNKPTKAKDRFKTRAGKEEDKSYDNHKLHIYTAASSFRSTTTTQAPWATIQTSISPLTKEKVYVVTSKPWLDAPNSTKEWFKVKTSDSKESEKSAMSDYDDTVFKSPRFFNRPSFGFTSIDKSDSVYPDSLYGFSKNWHEKINNLDTKHVPSSSGAESEGSLDVPSVNMDELFEETTTQNPHKDKYSNRTENIQT